MKMTVDEVLARMAIARHALANMLSRTDAPDRDETVEGLIEEILAWRRVLLVAAHETDLEVRGQIRPVAEWVVWQRELEESLAYCQHPAPKVADRIYEFVREIDLAMQLSNATVGIEGLDRES